jgi:hypothetical protein
MYVVGYLFLYCLWQLTYVVSKVEKLHTKYLLTKRTCLLLLSCSFLTLFVLVCVVLFFIVVLFFTCSFLICCLGFHLKNLCKHFFVTIHLYCVHFLCCLFRFTLFCSLLLFSCSLLVQFVLIVWVSVLFYLCKHFSATIHLYHVHFPCCWVCIVLLFVVVFLFST